MTKQTLFNKFLLWDKLHPGHAGGCTVCKWAETFKGGRKCTEKALHNICFKFWNIVEEKWKFTIDEPMIKIYEAKYYCAAHRFCMEFLDTDE